MSSYMERALELAKIALINDEVPVGAVVVQNDKIISEAYNQKEQKNNSLLHAEIIAISKACDYKKSWYLDDCTLYTTMEPCMMCCGAISQSRIKKIVYLLKNEKYGCTHLLENSKIEIIKEEKDEEMKNIIQNFFKNKRENN